MRVRYRPGSGSFKGIKRTKSDDQPGKSVRTGTSHRLTRKIIPNKSRRHPSGLPGTSRGKCLLSIGKSAAGCSCGGHGRKAA